MSKYLKRIIDKELDQKLETFGAINIVGPKWCGKTTSAEQKCKSAIKFQNHVDKEALIRTAEINPQSLLDGAKPKLIDEWQDAPVIWDAIRSYCDDNEGEGHFILTGSTSKKAKTSHTGTGRISKLNMFPMSLYESNESNGQVSLSKLFSGKENLENGCHSDLSLNNLIFAACRGGWPKSILLSKDSSKLAVANDYFKQIYEEDMFKVDNVKRNKKTMKRLIKSYARNISTLAKNSVIKNDLSAINNISDKTLDDYISVLEDLFIIEDLDAWCPAIRSKSAIRCGRKREFIDPSIAIAALGCSPESLKTDLKTFGFIFECLCIRDLRIYSQALGGEVSYYHDRYGLEADAVMHLENGKYALIEFKLGGKYIEEGAEHINKIENLIREYNKKNNKTKLRLPDLKIVITGSEYGYKRPDNVYIIPIGCLKD